MKWSGYKISRCLKYIIWELKVIGPMYNFISNKYVCVKVNGYKSTNYLLENWILQVSIIAPTLFNIYINDLVKALEINSKSKQCWPFCKGC